MERHTLLTLSLFLALQFCSLGRTIPVIADGAKALHYSNIITKKIDTVSAASRRQFIASFDTSEVHKTGVVQFHMNSGKISNITTDKQWHNGNGTIDIVGGIGSDSVSLHYDVPSGVGLDVTVNVYSDENVVDVVKDIPWSKNAFMHIKQDVAGEIVISVISDFETHNEARVDSYVLGSNQEAVNCYGYSEWHNGKGTRNLAGGIGEDRLDVLLSIPAGVRSSNSYSCVFSSSNEFSSKKGHFQEKVRSPVVTVLDEASFIYETYGTISPDSGNFHVIESVPGVIVDYENQPIWKSGTGTMSFIKGGVGFNYTEYEFVKSSGAYGTYEDSYTVAGVQELINH
ncbi:uncharacterized protein [Periplaneta americana]|uniref:uncharacterized protein isoform X2 n=1 Tax=Periplaneta americana TaxID=6978 RepID=UPI0037E8DA8E